MSNKAKPALHEILAVEQSLATVAKQLTAESIKTLQKDNLFKGGVKTHTLFKEEEAHMVQAPIEVQVETTVAENLEYLFNQGLVPYWDAVAQKDDANQRSKADVIIDGKLILKDVAGTTLLGLESKLGELIKIFNALPTLAPGRTWVQDENQRKGVFIDTVKEDKYQTRMIPDFIVMSEATPQHKAQIKETERQENVGKFTVTQFSGQISSIKKAEYITRLQKLISAVKQARQRANQVDVNSLHIGQDLTDYLLGN